MSLDTYKLLNYGNDKFEFKYRLIEKLINPSKLKIKVFTPISLDRLLYKNKNRKGIILVKGYLNGNSFLEC